MGYRLVPQLIVLAAVELGVGGEHTHELPYRLAGHGPVMPGGGGERGAAQALEAAVVPVHDGEVGLPYPAVAPDALGKVHDAAVAHTLDRVFIMP